MSSLYIHIPFCKAICYYCDFYFSLSLKNKDELLSALCQEIEEKASYLESNALETIYFGGGTPSVLSYDDVSRLFDCINEHFDTSGCTEITFEVNPDDIDQNYVSALRQTPINRISIGVQSFFDNDLKLMNRRHTANEAEHSLTDIFDAGFVNVTADLMFALPDMTEERLSFSLDKLLQFPVNHISAYNLTIEDGTAFSKFAKTKKIQLPSDYEALSQYQFLTNTLRENGFERYEVSNFARNGCISIHNTSYWKQIPYIGIGPSAHSYNGVSRQWNIANNRKYIAAIKSKSAYFEKEELSLVDRYNELVFTSLRTKWGIDQIALKEMFGSIFYSTFIENIVPFLDNGTVQKIDNNFMLTESGISIADRIASDLFLLSDT